MYLGLSVLITDFNLSFADYTGLAPKHLTREVFNILQSQQSELIKAQPGSLWVLMTKQSFFTWPSPCSQQSPSVKLNYGGSNKNLKSSSLSSNLEMWCLLASAAFSSVGSVETIEFHNPNIQLHY